MKIAYLSTFYPFRGGIAQFNASLYRALQNDDNQVEAFTFTTQYPSLLFPGDTQFVTEKDIVDEIPSKRVLSTINPISYVKTAKLINKFNPDILLMKYWMPFFAPSLGFVAGKMNSNTKVISILDNFIPHERKFFDTAFNKYFVKRNDGFIAMSEKVHQDLLNFSPKSKVISLKHPLYNHFGEKTDKEKTCKELKISSNKKTLLFFGFIRDYKGLDILIKAFDKLDESFQLIIAGEVYGSFDKYQNIIDKNSRKKDIHLHIKYISDNEVKKYFSVADLCILPYKSATQSGITGISFHFEVPMLATNVGGLAEIIEHEKTGYIVNSVSEKSIAEGINQFFYQNKQQEIINNIKALKKELSWEYFANNILKFADEL
jgi:glycosyltransferase involved in cell wall biosynthesis